MMLSSEAIERRAWNLLTRAKVKKPKVDVGALATQLGAIIRPVEAEDAISGAIVREGDRISIGVNAHHSLNRQRFTIAHELGHLVLHDAEAQIDHGYSETLHRGLRLAAFRDHTSREAIDDKEVEANRFAAALLMPMTFLEKSLRARPRPLREEDIRELAKEYGVSVQAMNFRLVNVGVAVDVAG
jgi:Zn-dependent peptidase ImmA (M78 family)